ncbi:MAG: hypothetical protein L0206_05160 [Actinobacteria bacterium]|nr:hypothetical protein [Actinomycetota bacterium]
MAYGTGNQSADALPVDLNGVGNRTVEFPAAPLDTTSACLAAETGLGGAGARPHDATDAEILGGVIFPPCTGDQAMRIVIASDADDVEELSGKISARNESLRFGHNGLVALRFNGVKVPNRARITSVALEGFARSKGTTPISIRYLGEKSGTSAPLPQSGGALLSIRPKTTSAVDDSPPPWSQGRFHSSPDLAAIVQEIVDQADWTSGNSLTLFVVDQGSSKGKYRLVSSYHSGAQRAPVLEITYEP